MSGPRFAFRRDLVAALTDALPPDVSVDYGWSGELRAREEIFLTETTGEVSVPVFTGQPSEANPLTYDDIFSFTITALAWKAGQTSAEADERGDELALVIEKSLRVDPTQTADTDYWQIIRGRITNKRTLTFGSKEGFLSTVEIDVEVHARVSGPAE